MGRCSLLRQEESWESGRLGTQHTLRTPVAEVPLSCKRLTHTHTAQSLAVRVLAGQVLRKPPSFEKNKKRRKTRFYLTHNNRDKLLVFFLESVALGGGLRFFLFLLFACLVGVCEFSLSLSRLDLCLGSCSFVRLFCFLFILFVRGARGGLPAEVWIPAALSFLLLCFVFFSFSMGVSGRRG